MIYFVLIFSFLFESVFSNIIQNGSFLTPLFFLTSLVVLFPYFKNKVFNFMLVCLICGLFYDIVFTSSIFVNTISFGISGAIIIVGYNYLNYNIYNFSLLNIIILIFYRAISYFILLITSDMVFNSSILFAGIYNSILVNIIYGIIIFIITDKLSKIFQIKRID